MKPSYEEVLNRIRSGEGIGEIAHSLLPATELEVLKRCASVRTFDEQLYDEVLLRGLKGSDSVPFEQIIEHEFVRKLPRAKGLYKLDDSSRDEYFRQWWKDAGGVTAASPGDSLPRPLVALSSALADYYQQRYPDHALDKLYHLVVADPAQARDLFIELYREADERFDLARCHDLIKILHERRKLLSEELGDFKEDRRLYLEARSLWATEYYQTASFYERESFKRLFDELLADKRRWILNLHAPGGRGKTMFLRWAIARRCAPAPARIPCARIDFDHFDRLAVTQSESWALFLKIVEQLNQQTPQKPFGEQLKRLRDRASANSAPAAPGMMALEVDHFASALREAHPGMSIVIIFDTLEEVMLYHQRDLTPLIRQIEAMRQKCPGIRLILSSRYDLTTQSDNFLPCYGEQYLTFRIEEFADEESRGYLREKRGLGTQYPVEAVIEKAEGNPFKLALFADILQDDPDLTAEEIRGYESEEVEVAYLTQRIINRIKDEQVKWLIRYGVIPRRLCLSFVKGVMAEHLRKGMAGTSADVTRNDIDSPSLQNRAPVFKQDLLSTPDQELDYNGLWKTLCQYASGSSWVYYYGDEQDTVGFHTDVVNPMRRILQYKQKETFEALNHDAVRYFEELAEAEPGEWEKWTREAVYHKFQLEGERAADYWRRLLRDPRVAANPRLRRALASEVTLSEYTDEGRPHVRDDGTKLIGEETLIEAYYEVANVNIELASSAAPDSRDELWSDAQDKFFKARALQSMLGRDVIPAARLAAVESALLINRREYEEAEKVIDAGLQHAADECEQAALFERLGDLWAARGDDRAFNFYSSALFTTLGAASTISLRRKLAGLFVKYEKYEEATLNYKLALDLVRSEDDFGRYSDLVEGIVDTYLKMSEVGHAARSAFHKSIKRLEQVKEPLGFERARLYLSQARVKRAAAEPLEALSICESVVKLTNSHEAKAAAREMLGLVLCDLCEYSQALEELDRARRIWKEVGAVEAANRCHLHTIEIQLKEVGNLRQATGLIERAGRLFERAEVESRVRYQLLRVHQLRLQREYKLALKQLEEVSPKTVAEEKRWGLLASIAAEGLALREDPGRWLQTLTAALTGGHKHATPTNLRGLRWCPRPDGIEERVRDEFIDILDGMKVNELSADTLNVVEAYRVVGEWGKADNLFGLIKGKIKQQGKLFLLKEVLDVRGRITRRELETDFIEAQLADFPRRYADYPKLCGAVLLQYAELLYSAGNAREADRRLREADAYLSKSQHASGWLARAAELRSQLMRELGDAAEARKAFEHTLGIYQHLGDSAAVRRLEEELAQGDEDDYNARLWESVGGHEVGQARHEYAIYDLIFSPDGRLLATASEDATARVWDAHTLRELLRVRHDDSVYDVIFSPDGRLLATAGADKTVRLWRLDDGYELARIPHRFARWIDYTFSPDGRLLATTGRDEKCGVWSVPGGAQLLSLRHDDPINKLGFSPDGRLLATASEDKTARVWDLESGVECQRFTAEGPLNHVAFSPDGRLLAACGEDNTARVWDLQDGREVARVIHDEPIPQLAFMPNGSHLVTASYDKTARVWDLRDGREVARMQHEKTIWDMTLSLDGHLLATGGGDHMAYVWETLTGRCVGALPHQRSVWAVAFSPDARHVATATFDDALQNKLRSLNREWACIVRLALDSEAALNVRTSFPDGERDSRQVAFASHPLLGSLVGVEPDETVSHPLLKRFQTDWSGVGQEIAASLLLPEELKRLTARDGDGEETAIDFRLEIEDERVAALPWECLSHPSLRPPLVSFSPAVRYFYRAAPQELLPVEEVKQLQASLNFILGSGLSVDGLYGRKTRQEVEKLQREHGLNVDGIAGRETRAKMRELLRKARLKEVPGVLILQPTLEGELAGFRGHRRSTDFDLLGVYAQAGFHVSSLECPTFEEVESLLGDEAPEVIHISATMRESPSVGLYLDFGERCVSGVSQTPRLDFYSLSELSHLLQILIDRRKARPLIVLDVARPPSSTEILIQLFLRNAFASSLFQMGSASAILAIGLGTYEQQRVVSEQLVRALAERKHVGEIARRIRRLVEVVKLSEAPRARTASWWRGRGSELHEIAAFAGVALFTQDPLI